MMEVVKAESKADLEEAFHVRYRAFSEVEKIIVPQDCPGGRYVDSFDFLPESVVYLGKLSGRSVCSVRLTRPSPVLRSAGANFRIGLSMEEWFDLRGFECDSKIAEVPKSAVVPEVANRGVILALYERIYRDCTREGVDALVAFANLQTDHQDDAVDAMKLVSERQRSSYNFTPRVHVGAAGSIRLPRVGGRIAKLPRPLRLFLAVGAEIAGAPAFIPPLKRYFVPIVIFGGGFSNGIGVRK